MTFTPALLNGFVAVVLVALLARLLLLRQHTEGLPPGPRGLPWIGIGLRAPNTTSLGKYLQWSREYGAIYYFTSFGRSTLVLNSSEMVLELLERRGGSYANRPYRPLFIHAGLSEALVTGHEYTPRIQKMRKMVFSVFGEAGKEHYVDVLSQECHRFLSRVFEDPHQMAEHINTSVAASIADVTYAYDVCDPQDPTIPLLREGAGRIVRILRAHATMTSAFPISLVRYLPKCIPGTELYQDAAELFRYSKKINEELVSLVRLKAAGTARKSFLGEILDNPEATAEMEDQGIWASFMAFTAGFLTMAHVIHMFVVAMMLHPEVQARAQEEVDSVIGSGRLPSPEDEAQLPYTSAIIKEVLRWSPPNPIGVAHCANKDDIYKGYRIPKGTTVIAHIAALFQDSQVYSSPEKFKPDRFLGASSECDPTNFVFGFGPRSCPGSAFAKTSLFLHVAAILTVFNVTPLKGAPLIDPADQSKLPLPPAPINCTLELRSESARALVEAATKRNQTD